MRAVTDVGSLTSNRESWSHDEIQEGFESQKGENRDDLRSLETRTKKSNKNQDERGNSKKEKKRTPKLGGDESKGKAPKGESLRKGCGYKTYEKGGLPYSKKKKATENYYRRPYIVTKRRQMS